jgi:hypothetical protein
MQIRKEVYKDSVKELRCNFCGSVIPLHKPVHARFCSANCRMQHFRYLQNRRKRARYIPTRNLDQDCNSITKVDCILNHVESLSCWLTQQFRVSGWKEPVVEKLLSDSLNTVLGNLKQSLLIIKNYEEVTKNEKCI